MWSPIILIEFLLAPTVPSAPRPQNLQAVVPAGAVIALFVRSSERFVTSSTIPTVKFFYDTLSHIAKISAGVVFLEPRP
jgi:hypothetical protein